MKRAVAASEGGNQTAPSVRAPADEDKNECDREWEIAKLQHEIRQAQGLFKKDKDKSLSQSKLTGGAKRSGTVVDGVGSAGSVRSSSYKGAATASLSQTVVPETHKRQRDANSISNRPKADQVVAATTGQARPAKSRASNRSGLAKVNATTITSIDSHDLVQSETGLTNVRKGDQLERALTQVGTQTRMFFERQEDRAPRVMAHHDSKPTKVKGKGRGMQT